MGTVPIGIKVFPSGIPVPHKTAGRKGIRDFLIPRIHPAAKDAFLPLIPEDVHTVHHQFRPVHFLCIDLIHFSRNHLDLGSLPQQVILNGSDVLVLLRRLGSQPDACRPDGAKPDEVDLQQMSIFDTVNEDDIIKEIMELEVNRMSPLDALNTLDKLQAKLKNRWMHQ